MSDQSSTDVTKNQEDNSLTQEKEKTNHENTAVNFTGTEVFVDDGGKVDLNADEYEDDDDDDNPQCGWFNLRPKWMQVFNGGGGFLLFISMYSIAQSTTVNGLVYVITTTLERRFSLPSARSGSISSAYDLSVLIVILFVTYFGERAHKPVWLGIGAFIFGCGSFLFTLPHFLTGPYEYGTAVQESACSINRTLGNTCDAEEDENLSKYYWVFIAAQVLHGIGASPLYTLGQTYIYSNADPKVGSVYIGVFQIAGNFAPAIGYIVGGYFLTIYTDMNLQDEQSITPKSPLWVGNWWLGFVCTGSLALLTSIPLMAYPRRLPGTKHFNKNVKKMNQKGKDFVRSGEGVRNVLLDFPRAICNLLTNIPYMCVVLATSAEFFIIACISVFGPKFVESQFTVSTAEAAILTGVVIIPSALGGVLLGGFAVKWLSLQFRGRVIFNVCTLGASWLMMTVVLFSCPNKPFAGVTVDYNNIYKELSIGESQLNSTCNANCNCLPDYDPVCGSNEILYYSGCHAGCTVVDNSGELKEFSDCNCISEDGTATQGRCVDDAKCELQTPFFIVIFFILFFTFLTVAPTVTAILAVVDENQRTLSLGIQSLFYRLLGTVPAPIVFGLLIDSSCMIWEDTCDGSKTCWQYDNADFANYLFTILFTCRVVSLMLSLTALIFYKQADNTGGGDPKALEKKTLDAEENTYK